MPTTFQLNVVASSKRPRRSRDMSRSAPACGVIPRSWQLQLAGSRGRRLNERSQLSAVLTQIHSRVNNNRGGGDGGISNGVPLPGLIPRIGGLVTLNDSQATRRHGKRRRRHLQRRCPASVTRNP